MPQLSPSGQNAGIAQLLLAQGLRGGPVRTNTEGFGKLAQALAGAFMQRQQNEKEEEKQAATAKSLANVFGAGNVPAQTATLGGSQPPVGPGALTGQTPATGTETTPGRFDPSLLGPALAREIQTNPEVLQSPIARALLGQMMESQQTSPVAVGINQRLVNPVSGETLVPATPKPDKPINPDFITLQQGKDESTRRTLDERSPEVAGLLSQGFTEVRTPAASFTVNNPPELTKLEPGKSYAIPDSSAPDGFRTVNVPGAVTPAETLLRNMTPAQKAVDTAYAPEYVDLIVNGSLADARKNVQQLRSVRERLLAGEDLTGAQGFLPTPVRSLVDEESVSVQEQVEEVIQRNLRTILGAQFTEKEGNRLISRAFNPRLKEAENAERLGRLLDAMDGALNAKEVAARYFEEKGTLRGYEGTVQFSISDIEKAVTAEPDQTSQKQGAPSSGAGVQNIQNMSFEDALNVDVMSLPDQASRDALRARLSAGN